MNITITGNLGSGKSSVCKELAKAGFTIISAGDIFREIAAEKGMTVIELNEAAKKDRSIDDMLDHRTTLLGEQMDHTVFDSRLAWHFARNSFKVFLLVDTDEAARRVFAGNQRNAEEYHSINEAAEGLRSRAALEQERFSSLYGIDYYDGSNYDFIIESSCATPQQIAQEIIRNFELYQKHPFHAKVELNVQCLYPGKRFAEMNPERLKQFCLEEQEDNQSLCAKAVPYVWQCQGYHYISSGHHRVFAAAAAGKVFAKVQWIYQDEGRMPKTPVLSEEDFMQFEKAGDFSYQMTPVQVPKKAGYTLHF